MHANKQRIAIAEACLDYEDLKTGKNFSHSRNYPADLNAMHEAEKVLTGKQWEKYICGLHEPYGSTEGKIPENLPGFWDSDYMRITATAAQRAEAFLRTINKWEDSA